MAFVELQAFGWEGKLVSKTDKGALSRPPEPANKGESSPWAQVCLCQEGRVGGPWGLGPEQGGKGTET